MMTLLLVAGRDREPAERYRGAGPARHRGAVLARDQHGLAAAWRAWALPLHYCWLKGAPPSPV